MLVEFSVQNYLSFHSRVTLSLRAAALGEEALDRTFLAAPGLRLLRSAVIYGANASGKSNLIKALRFARRFAINSSKEWQATERIPVRRFALSTASAREPSEFEVVFLHEQVRYRYGFSLDEEQVHREWLLRAAPDQAEEEELFQRDSTGIRVRNGFPEGAGLERRTRRNALFLSLVAQLNGEVAGQVLLWFGKLRLRSGLADQPLNLTARMLKDAKASVLEMARQADLGILDLQVEHEKSLSYVLTAAEDSPKLKVRVLPRLRTAHQIFDEARRPVDDVLFDLEDESGGTQKFLSLSGPILDVLASHKILVIDEFDARLHPLLSRAIVQMFHDGDSRSQAQLIFATHDSNLLDRRLFRKDQVWFTEKDRYGATALYSLAEFRLGDDANYERDYIRGKFGAIPLIGDLWKAGEE